MDVYMEAKKIANELKAEGFEAYQENINDAIAYGSVGTEIIMHLRQIFNEILNSNLVINHTLIFDIKKLRDEIEQLLR